MPQLTLKNYLWAPPRHNGCQPQWGQRTANLGTVRWEGAPAEKNAVQRCGCGGRGREQKAPNEAKSRSSSPFLPLVPRAWTFFSRHSSPTLGKPLLLRDKDLKVEGAETDGTAQGPTDCICVGKECRGNRAMNHKVAGSAETTAGFPMPRNPSASSVRELRNSLQYLKLWPERRLVSPQIKWKSWVNSLWGVGDQTGVLV